jgi:MFS family permease
MDRRVLILVGNVLYSIAIILYPFTHSFIEVLGLSLLLGIFGAIPLPAATALIVEEGKKYGMGSTMAVFNVAMSLGLGSGPLVSGLIHDISGLKAVFYFSAVLGVFGTLVAGHFLSASPPPPEPSGEHAIAEDM